jgi:hypothetical protein
MFSRRPTMSIAIAATAIVIAGGAYGIVSATGSNSSAAASTAASAAPSGRAGGSNARSGPAAGGSVGTVASVSTSGFTLLTSAGQTVTVNKAASTTYLEGTSSTSASAVKKRRKHSCTRNDERDDDHRRPGDRATGNRRLERRGRPLPARRTVHVKASRPDPRELQSGVGTIVGGTTANKATEAALGAYPGGIIDRVVKLSNGEYEVHNIGVNWPHHIFVSQNSKVVGAN